MKMSDLLSTFILVALLLMALADAGCQIEVIIDGVPHVVEIHVPR